jgi:hypothetical protein
MAFSGLYAEQLAGKIARLTIRDVRGKKCRSFLRIGLF